MQSHRVPGQVRAMTAWPRSSTSSAGRAFGHGVEAPLPDGRTRPLLVPSEPAEHLHGQAHRADVRRHVCPRPPAVSEESRGRRRAARARRQDGAARRGPLSRRQLSRRGHARRAPLRADRGHGRRSTASQQFHGIGKSHRRQDRRVPGHGHAGGARGASAARARGRAAADADPGHRTETRHAVRARAATCKRRRPAGRARQRPGRGVAATRREGRGRTPPGAASASTTRSQRLPLAIALPAAEEVMRQLQQCCRGGVDRARRAAFAAGRKPPATSTSWSPPPSRRRSSHAFTSLPLVKQVLGAGDTRAVDRHRRRRADRPARRRARQRSARRCSTSRARKSTTSSCARWRFAKGSRSTSTASFAVDDDATQPRQPHRGGGLRRARAALDSARAARGRGRNRARSRGKLPRLVELGDIRGDLHLHTRLTDGSSTSPRWSRRGVGARLRVHGDHRSQSGARHHRWADRRRIARRARADRGAAAGVPGHAPAVRRRGRHSRRRAAGLQRRVPGESATSWWRRSTRRCRNRATVQTVAPARGDREPARRRRSRHPTGRLLGKRPGYEFDLRAVLDALARTGTAIEVSGQPERLDLDADAHPRGRRSRRAAGAEHRRARAGPDRAA